MTRWWHRRRQQRAAEQTETLVHDLVGLWFQAEALGLGHAQLALEGAIRNALDEIRRPANGHDVQADVEVRV